MSSEFSFAVDNTDDYSDDCYICRGKRLLERNPDRKTIRCINCPYKEHIEQMQKDMKKRKVSGNF